MRRRKTFEEKSFVLWSHIGLGDTISVYPALVAFSGAGKLVYLPSKERNLQFVADLVRHIGGVKVFPIPNDPNLELTSIREFANKNKLPVLYAGHFLYHILTHVKTGFGINGLLNFLAGYQGNLVSDDLRGHLLASGGCEPRSDNYVFVDHHPGTQREIPSEIVAEIRAKYHVEENNLDWSIAELAKVMDGAKEVHLVSSAPLCLALTANLASGGKRVRYRVGNSFPLANDYPADWSEKSLSDHGIINVSRKADAQVSVFGRVLIHLARPNP
jgi:hypothetical protein